MSNTTAIQRPKFSTAIQTEGYKKLVNNTLQDPKRAQRFIASISSAVAANPALQECDAGSILSCALVGEALELSPSPQLGQYYLVPFNNKDRGKLATFILGYKGYIQLAIRSGQYKRLNVLAIKKGELIRYNPLSEEIEVSFIQDELERETTETIGYYAMFEYVNGYVKTLYWSKTKMIQHAERYSAAFGPAKQSGNFPGRVSYEQYLAGNYAKGSDWVYSSFWYKDFDGMAYKTMLRQIISKWGIMSVEMIQAFESDGNTINASGSPEYINSEDIPHLQGEAMEQADIDNDDPTADTNDGQTTLTMADIE